MRLSFLFLFWTMQCISCQARTDNPTSQPVMDTSANLYSIPVKSLDGTSLDLSQYRGKKILVVNTASECGYTPQYKDLETLYQQHKDRLVVIGFPCNDFGGQEPGSPADIRQFCTKNYGVSFPMGEKVSIRGGSVSPLYAWLTQKSRNHVSDATVRWNFHKFLIDENGQLIRDFPSSVNPLSTELTSLL